MTSGCWCGTPSRPGVDPVELGRHEWPGRFRILIEGLAKSPEGTVAETWHAPTIAEKLDMTAEEVRAALEKVPWVVM